MNMKICVVLFTFVLSSHYATAGRGCDDDNDGMLKNLGGGGGGGFGLFAFGGGALGGGGPGSGCGCDEEERKRGKHSREDESCDEPKPRNTRGDEDTCEDDNSGRRTKCRQGGGNEGRMERSKTQGSSEYEGSYDDGSGNGSDGDEGYGKRGQIEESSEERDYRSSSDDSLSTDEAEEYMYEAMANYQQRFGTRKSYSCRSSYTCGHYRINRGGFKNLDEFEVKSITCSRLTRDECQFDITCSYKQVSCACYLEYLERLREYSGSLAWLFDIFGECANRMYSYFIQDLQVGYKLAYNLRTKEWSCKGVDVSKFQTTPSDECEEVDCDKDVAYSMNGYAEFGLNYVFTEYGRAYIVAAFEDTFQYGISYKCASELHDRYYLSDRRHHRYRY